MAGRIGNETAAMERQAGQDIDRGLKGVEQGADTLGRYVQNHQALQEITAGAAGLATTLDNLTQHYDQASKSADPFDPNFSADWRANVMTPALQQFQDQFQTPAGKEWAARHVATLETEMYRHTVAADQDRARDHALLGVTQTANSLSNVVQRNPGMIDTALSMVPGTVDALAANSNLSPEAGSKLKTTLGQQLSEHVVLSGLKSAIDADPDAGLKLAQSGKYDKYISGEQVETLYRYSQTVQRMQTAQQKAIDAETRRENREDAQDALTKLTAGTIQPNGTTAIGPDYFKQLVQIGQMPGVNSEELRAASRWAHTVTQDQIDGTHIQPNPAIVDDFNARMFKPTDDPAALGMAEVYSARAEHQIDDKQFNFYRSAVEKNAKSDQNQQLEQKMVNQSLSEAQQRLHGDSFGTDAGRRAYSRLLQWFQPAFAAATRDGKMTPSDAVAKLLTPERIDSFNQPLQPNAGSGLPRAYAPLPPKGEYQKQLGKIFDFSQ